MALANTTPQLEMRGESRRRTATPHKQPFARSRTQISARQPLFWAAMCFCCGIVAGNYVWRPESWWVCAAALFVISATYFLRRRKSAATILIFATWFVGGALSIQLRTNSVSAGSQVWLGDGESVVTAHVFSEGEVQAESPNSFRQRIDVQTEEIQDGAATKFVSEGVRLTIYQTDRNLQRSPLQVMPLLRYGQRIRFRTSLISPRNYRNPGAFDYAGYLRDQGIVASASAKYANVEALPGFAGSQIELWRSRAHRSVLEKIHALWPERTAALMDAIVIGEDAFIERRTRVEFQRSGTYHILVVSGMNVSILALFALWVLRRFGMGDIAASLGAIVLVLAYAVLTKEGAPVWRAALMFAVYLCTRLLYRDRAMLNALGLAALILLIADPRQLFGASFQMTFLCVALVAGIGIPILERTIQPYSQGLRNLNAVAYDRALPPKVAQFRLDLRLLLDRMAKILPDRFGRRSAQLALRIFFGLLELTLMSAVLQLGLALPMAYYFHRATSMALPANLLVIPFLELLMPAAVLAICVSYISVALAKLPALVGGFALQGIAGTVGRLGGIRVADIRVPTPAPSAVLFATASILLCAVLMRRRTWLAACGVFVFTLGALSIWLIPPSPHVHAHILEMTAVDVGQGDSILLVTPQGRTVLVDAGGLPFWTHSQMDIGEDVVSPYLWSRGISRLDVVALTHAHADHMGGMFAVISNFHPRELWLPGGIPEEEIGKLLAEARNFGLTTRYWKADDSFNYGGTAIRVLAPRAVAEASITGKKSRRNDESLVLRVSYGKTSALLEGDAEQPTEKFIESETPAADVLKVAHHGSASSTSEALLAAVRPRYAVISVGYRNVYHHPRGEVLQRLQDARVITYRTDMDGATTFLLDGKKVTAQLATVH